MKSKYITNEDNTWVENEINQEYMYLSEENKSFFNKFKLDKIVPYPLINPTIDDDCMFIILIYNDHVVLFDDIEELFSVGKLENNKLVFNGNFTSLEENINYLKNLILLSKTQVL